MTNDTPEAYKAVIRGLVPSIRAGDGVEFLSGIVETRAAWDPRVTHEDDDVRCTRDDDGGAFRPGVSRHGRWYRCRSHRPACRLRGPLLTAFDSGTEAGPLKRRDWFQLRGSSGTTLIRYTSLDIYIQQQRVLSTSTT